MRPLRAELCRCHLADSHMIGLGEMPDAAQRSRSAKS
jgi:hypothetical protein